MRLLLVIVLTATPALAQDGGLTLVALSAEVRGRVAPEWTVERTSDGLRLSRAITVEAADAHLPVARPATFSLVLTAGAPLSQKQRAAQMKRNDSLRKQLDALHRKMRAFECDEQRQAYAEGGCFSPRNQAEAKQALAARTLERQLAEVPTHHLGDFRPVRVEAFVDAERRRWFHVVRCGDCEQVEQLIPSLLTPY